MSAHTVNSDPSTMAFLSDLHTKANQLRALLVEIADLKTRWDSGIGSQFGKSDDTWDEGRAIEGIRPLTSAQVTEAAGELFKIAAGGVSELNSAFISAMAVGPLKAQ